MLNKWIGIGRLGREPELRYTANGKAVCDFSIAVDGGSRDSTEWVNIVAWEKTAENCSKYITKGSKVFIEGRLQTRQWEDNDGNKRRKTEVVASRVLFLDDKKDTTKQQSNDLGAQEVPFDEEAIPF